MRCLFSNLYFKYCRIDAIHTECYAKYANDMDSNHLSNAVMKKIICDETSKLCLFAKKKIKTDTEIRYNYGYKNAWKRVRRL